MSRFLVLLLFLFLPASPAAAKIVNGPVTVSTDRIPQRVVTMNQAATEIMLALGLEKNMIGTAYLDDTILPRFSKAWAAIPVLAEKYPAREILIDSKPDFVYAGYASAFSEKRGLATRDDLKAIGAGSYLSPSELAREGEWHIALLYQEIREIGAIFHVPERAEELIAGLKEKMAAHTTAPAGKKPRILWLDSVGDATPFIGAGTGVPNEIIEISGGENIFADIPKKWAKVSMEQILARPVDIIVLIDATWNTAEKKRAFLARDPLFSTLEAVKKRRYVEIPFSASTPGIRIPGAVTVLRRAVEEFGNAR